MLLELGHLSSDSIAALIPVLLSIQSQLASGAVPADYYHRGLPAPWMQVEVLALLRMALGQTEQRSQLSPETLDALDATVMTALEPSKETAGQALAFEAVRLVAALSGCGDGAKRDARALSIGENTCTINYDVSH